MRNICKNIILFFYNMILSRKYHAEIGFGANLRNCRLEGHNVIGKKVKLQYSKVGFATFIGDNSDLMHSSIGKYCSISWNVRLIAGTHPTHTYVSTHPLFFSTRQFKGLQYSEETVFQQYRYANEEKKGYAHIGNDVWIGADVLILSGVTIGNGAIVGAGSVVSADIPAYAIAVGVPCKVVRYRFSPEQIVFLETDCWWNKNPAWLKQNVKRLRNIEDYVQM